MTFQETHFIETLCADPNDDAARLVYADWLEEQGDTRAAFLRAEIAFVGSFFFGADTEAKQLLNEASFTAGMAKWPSKMALKFDLEFTKLDRYSLNLIELQSAQRDSCQTESVYESSKETKSSETFELNAKSFVGRRSFQTLKMPLENKTIHCSEDLVTILHIVHGLKRATERSREDGHNSNIRFLRAGAPLA